MVMIFVMKLLYLIHNFSLIWYCGYGEFSNICLHNCINTLVEYFHVVLLTQGSANFLGSRAG